MYCDGVVCSAGDRAANRVDSIWENENYLDAGWLLRFAKRSSLTSEYTTILAHEIAFEAELRILWSNICNASRPISIDRDDNHSWQPI